ncbi:MAG TPA: hypothetical protein VGH75_00480 [Steroidobacteraceae bacterium]
MRPGPRRSAARRGPYSSSSRPLAFRTRAQAQAITLEPLNSIFDERYVVYWKVPERTAQTGAA